MEAEWLDWIQHQTLDQLHASLGTRHELMVRRAGNRKELLEEIAALNAEIDKRREMAKRHGE